MKKSDRKLNIGLNKKYLRLSINYFTLFNKLLLNLSKKSSKLLDKATDEQLRECIMSNCNNIFQMITDFENVIKYSKEAYISFQKEGEDINAKHRLCK